MRTRTAALALLASFALAARAEAQTGPDQPAPSGQQPSPGGDAPPQPYPPPTYAQPPQAYPPPTYAQLPQTDPPPAYGQPPQTYPPPTYAQPPAYYPPPAYGPPPAYYAPPTYAQPRPVYVRPRYLRPFSPDPYAHRFLRGYVGVSGLGTFVLGQTGGVETLDHGGGLSIFGGLDFGRIFGLELSYTGSFHNPASGCSVDPYYLDTWCDTNYLVVDMLTLSARLRVPTGMRVQPYFQAGGAIAWIGRQGYAADATGGGFEAGGGFDLWLGNHFSLGPRVLYRGLRMSDYATVTGSDTWLSLLTVDLNLAVRF